MDHKELIEHDRGHGAGTEGLITKELSDETQVLEELWD